MDERIAEELRTRIRDELASGQPRYEVLQKLVEEGHDRKEAEVLLQTEEERRHQERTGGGAAADQQPKRKPQAGRYDMITGGIYVALGTGATFFSIGGATSGRGYVIWWGAILFGGIRFVRGMIKASKGGSPDQLGERKTRRRRYDF